MFSWKNFIRYIYENNDLLQYFWLKKIWRTNRRIANNLSDTDFAYIKYKERTGKKLNLENPQTFDEKLWYLKLNYKNPLMTKCSDKYLVREYVKECGLGHILNEMYGVYDNARDIDFEALPNNAFLKCNHTSGYNIIWDKSKPFNKSVFVRRFNYILKQNYFYASREWNYKNIRPRIICEKILETNANLGLVDYRFFCFSGICELITVDIDTCAADGTHSGVARRNVYDKEFNLLNVKLSRSGFDEQLINKPTNFDLMIEYAERLSKPFPHVRVDLYNIDGKIIFGEMTFYHQGGCNKIEPWEWDLKLGSWIDISGISSDRQIETSINVNDYDENEFGV